MPLPSPFRALLSLAGRPLVTPLRLAVAPLALSPVALICLPLLLLRTTVRHLLLCLGVIITGILLRLGPCLPEGGLHVGNGYLRGIRVLVLTSLV